MSEVVLLSQDALKSLVYETVKKALLEHSANPNREWMNVEEAADYIRRTPSALYKLVHTRQIQSRGTDRKLVFKRSDLDDFLDNS